MNEKLHQLTAKAELSRNVRLCLEGHQKTSPRKKHGQGLALQRLARDGTF